MKGMVKGGSAPAREPEPTGGKSNANYLTADGREKPDPTPMEPPIGFNRQPSLAEQIRTMVRSEALRQAAEKAGAESFEEADDFEVGDDYDPSSPYEQDFDQVPISELRARAAAAEAAVKAAEAKAEAASKDEAKAPAAAPQAPQSDDHSEGGAGA